MQAKSRDVVPHPRPPVLVAQVHLPAIVPTESTKRKANRHAARKTRNIVVGHESRTEVANLPRNGPDHDQRTVTEIVDRTDKVV